MLHHRLKGGSRAIKKKGGSRHLGIDLILIKGGTKVKYTGPHEIYRALGRLLYNKATSVGVASIDQHHPFCHTGEKGGTTSARRVLFDVRFLVAECEASEFRCTCE
jgi:hypothetical protein